MSSNKILPPGCLLAVRRRFAAAVLAALSVVIVTAGFLASTQAQAASIAGKPTAFLSDDLAQGTVAGGRPAHRLCRSPIRFLGTAEGRQVPDCKRAEA